MSALNARLARLRSILHEPPTPSAWDALCTCLDAWPANSGFQTALDYAESHLTDWPDTLRIAPFRWKLRGGRTTAVRRWTLIRALDRSSQRLTARDIRRLNTPAVSTLTHICVDHNLLNDDAAFVLAESPHLKALRHLSLRHNNVGNAGLRLLLTSPSLSTLESLAIGHNACDERAFADLTDHPSLHKAAQLRHLDLGGHPILGDGLHNLASIPWFHELKTLSLYGISANPTGLHTFLTASSRRWSLERLDLSFNAIADVGLRVMCVEQNMPALTELHLSRCAITSTGLENMLRLAPGWLATVRFLDLSDNRLGDRSIRALLENETLTPELTLKLSRNRFSSKGLRTLEEHMRTDEGPNIILADRPWKGIFSKGHPPKGVVFTSSPQSET